MSGASDAWISIPFSDSSFSAFPGLSIPPELKVSDDGSTLEMACLGKTDWWRVPFEQGRMRDSADGPAWGFARKVGKEGFEVRCEVDVGATTQVGLVEGSKVQELRRRIFDQAQFLCYLSPTEWVKVGVEYDNDALWCGAVVCNPYSDWSIQPPPSGPTTFTISYDPSTTTLHVYLNDIMMREVKSFGMYSAGGGDGRPASISNGSHGIKAPAEVLADKEVWMGAMACSPLGSTKEGEMAKATFKNLQVREGAR